MPRRASWWPGSERRVAPAAAEAAGAGADILVLERTSGWESAAGALSGGLIYLGGGTAIQRACGFEDTPENMFKFLMAAMGPGVDEDRCRGLLREQRGALRLAGGVRGPVQAQLLGDTGLGNPAR